MAASGRCAISAPQLAPLIFSPPSSPPPARRPGALRHLKAHPELRRSARHAAYARAGSRRKTCPSSRPSRHHPIIYLRNGKSLSRPSSVRAGVYVNPVLPPATDAKRGPVAHQLHGSITKPTLRRGRGDHRPASSVLRDEAGPIVTAAAAESAAAPPRPCFRAGVTVYEFSRPRHTKRGVTHIACDVTQEAQVRAAVGQVLSARAARLW
jgi:hypothetical protein